MIKKAKKKPILVIAGPGAGKTYGMVQEIIKVLPTLSPNRILATITFTNSATESIRKSLDEKIQIPSNVFIGTNHSFFNRFILKPYATIFDFLPQEKVFLEMSVHKTLDEMMKKKGGKTARTDPAQRNMIRSRLITKLLAEGKIPYEQIVKVSSKIIKENKQVANLVGYRLQYLFIDEFQDADNDQFRIFERLRIAKQTQIYAVGDPEQYINSFTYIEKAGKKPSFNSIPINKFRQKATVQLNVNNRRSYQNIIDFTNQFHSEIQQKTTKGYHPNSGVYFSNSLDLKIIVREFQEFITKKIEKSEKNVSFYLAKENATFMDIAGEFGLYPISNAKLRPVNVLKESLKLITFAIEKSKKQICDEHNLDSIEYRKIGMKLVRLFQETPDFGESDLHTFLKNNFPNEDLNNSFSSSSSQIQLLKNLLLMKNDGGEHIYSSIHKAKGLEADAVLIVAKTSNELKKWLTINREERQADKMDSCRIGFVGFTRAKQILCIACVKPIDDDLCHNLSELKIKHLNEETSSNDSELTSRQLPLIDI